MINLAYKERCSPLLPEDPEQCSGGKLVQAGGAGRVDDLSSSDSTTSTGRSGSDPSHESTGVHLLSIFPLVNAPEFARVSCMPVINVPTPCGSPFCTSRAELKTLLSRILPLKRVEAVLETLESRTEVQMTIHDDDARALGFMARIM